MFFWQTDAVLGPTKGTGAVWHAVFYCLSCSFLRILLRCKVIVLPFSHVDTTLISPMVVMYFPLLPNTHSLACRYSIVFISYYHSMFLWEEMIICGNVQKVSEGKLCTGVTSVVTLFFLSILMHFLMASCYKTTSREMPYVLFFLSSKLALMLNQHQGIRHRILFCETQPRTKKGLSWCLLWTWTLGQNITQQVPNGLQVLITFIRETRYCTVCRQILKTFWSAFHWRSS